MRQRVLGSWATAQSGQSCWWSWAPGQARLPRLQAGRAWPGTAGPDTVGEARPISHRLPCSGRPESPQGGRQLCPDPSSSTYELCDLEKSLDFSGAVIKRQIRAGLRSLGRGERAVKRQKGRPHPSNPRQKRLLQEAFLENPNLAAHPPSNHSTPHSAPASVCAKHTLFQDLIMGYTTGND